MSLKITCVIKNEKDFENIMRLADHFRKIILTHKKYKHWYHDVQIVRLPPWLHRYNFIHNSRPRTHNVSFYFNKWQLSLFEENNIDVKELIQKSCNVVTPQKPNKEREFDISVIVTIPDARTLTMLESSLNKLLGCGNWRMRAPEENVPFRSQLAKFKNEKKVIRAAKPTKENSATSSLKVKILTHTKYGVSEREIKKQLFLSALK